MTTVRFNSDPDCNEADFKVENEEAFWSDIGKHWYMSEQYYKPYPVCRWAQAPIEGAKKLIAKYGFKSSDIKKIEVDTFHEVVRLATNQPTNQQQQKKLSIQLHFL